MKKTRKKNYRKSQKISRTYLMRNKECDDYLNPTISHQYSFAFSSKEIYSIFNTAWRLNSDRLKDLIFIFYLFYFYINYHHDIELIILKIIIVTIVMVVMVIVGQRIDPFIKLKKNHCICFFIFELFRTK